jgi:hypothetical protein
MSVGNRSLRRQADVSRIETISTSALFNGSNSGTPWDAAYSIDCLEKWLAPVLFRLKLNNSFSRLDYAVAAIRVEFGPGQNALYA